MAEHKSLEHWGKETAKARYGDHIAPNDDAAHAGKKITVGLIDQPMLDEDSRIMQAPQSVNDRHGANYDNDSQGWVRGMPSAESKPSFDHGPSGNRYGKGK